MAKKKGKKAARRACSHILHASARTIEYGCFMVNQLLSENEAAAKVQEGPLIWCLTEQEVKLINQRRATALEMAKDLRTIAQHLRRTSV